jgi:AmmeMemoRadiSam system protein B/AmmeMemoRadiSam system protein A
VTAAGVTGATGAADWVREPAVAGLFYPAQRDRLRAAVVGHLEDAPEPSPAIEPQAVIAPHAGYRYSGATAGAAYRAVAARRDRVERVVLAGPAHRVAVGGVGVGVSTAQAWRTPLGDVPLDVDAVRELVASGLAVEADDAHAPEHSLEVHLPFLLEVLGPVVVVPLVVGRCQAQAVADVLHHTWDGERTLVVVSSDLSHYLDEGQARRRDERTRMAIIESRPADIGPYDACGCVAIAGLLLAARRKDVAPRTLALATSADTSGDPSRVVGYGSFGFEPPPALTDTERAWLARRVRAAIARELETGDPDALADEDVPERLHLPAATFVTLETGGELAGCIGSLEPMRPLWVDVARNGRGAAFADPRFPPLASGALDGTVVKVSVLSSLEPAPAARHDLLACLRPGEDGLVLEAGGKRATFLPAVWEKLPAPERFVAALLAKAELPAEPWPADLRAWRYTADEFSG